MVLKLGHSESGSEIPGNFLNVVLEKIEVDQRTERDRNEEVLILHTVKTGMCYRP
jgi:hypothetical protein